MRSSSLSYATPERANCPLGLDGFDECDRLLVRDVVGLREVGQHPLQELTQRGDLLLLDLPGHGRIAGPRLQIEGALPGFADGARGEHPDVAQVE